MRLLPLMLLVVCCSASADWTPIAWANEGALWEYEPERVRRNGNKLELWIKSSGSKVKEVKGRMYKERPDLFTPREASKFENNFAYDMVRWEIDCRSWEHKLITSQMYDTDGMPLGVAGIGSNQEPIYPGSLMDVAAAKLCHSKKR